MKTRLHDRLRATNRDRVAPDTGPMTGSTINQQPSTVRGEAHVAEIAGWVRVAACQLRWLLR
jgi:hypothetical protein